MREYEITADLPEDRRLVVDLPDQFHPGKIVLRIVQEEESFETKAAKSKERLLAFLDTLPSRNIPSRSIEEIDRYIEEERRSWDR
jgi:hypothetical protein